MPRRPSKKANRGGGGKPRTLNREDGKLKRWDKASDVPLDEEDQFHASRDKILLEGDEYRADDDGDEDEVFGLKGLEEDESDDDVEQDYDAGEAMEEAPAAKKNAKKNKPKSKKKSAESEESGESESEEETWGRGKGAYYASNAEQLESDDEEGNELEEQEAKRLQAKAREGMSDKDFGLDDLLELEGIQDTDDLVEPILPVSLPLPTDPKAIIRHLEKTSPETLALARDWEDTAQNLIKTHGKLQKLQAEQPDALTLGMTHLHYQALLTYSSTLAFFLHLRASAKYAQHPDLLKSHPILTRLLTLKQSLTTLEDLDFAPEGDGNSNGDDSSEGGIGYGDEDTSMDDDLVMDREHIWALDNAGSLESDELEELLQDATTSKQSHIERSKPPRKKRKTAPDSTTPPAHVFDLIEPDFPSSKASSAPSQPDIAMIDAYGEVTSLQHADATDKAAHKKNLRFHTSKIESASARRQGARNQAAGGDDDLPYRERKKDKDARLAKEAKSKLRGQGGQDLDDTEPERKPDKRRREEDSGEDEADGPDGYYELVKKKSKERKEQKKAEYEAAVARPDIDEADTNGPRSLTRAILANKGLTPHRPKSVRNPRVKKRLKFEKTKKKLASQKAVYKGGLAETGRYDGERSGISKVVKSVRLG